MITGFITTQVQAQAVNDAVAQAQISRDLPVFWLPGKLQIFSGPHAGSWIVPADDALFDTPLRGTPPMTPRDFPEFPALIESLGGMDARVEIDNADTVPPNLPE
jgi:hypothetical protein